MATEPSQLQPFRRIIHEAIQPRQSISILLGMAPLLAHAGLEGSIIEGTATISTSGNTTIINQTSDKVVIDFQQFNIGVNDTVQFIQPSASAIALNRINTGQGTTIFGQLQANGQIFLINPQGITFANTAKIDVSGIVATTLDITNQDFLANAFSFSKANQLDGKIVNQGQINAQQYVVLAGDVVDNSGTVAAQLGQATFASGSRITLDLQGDGLINFAVDTASVSDLAGVTNTGDIAGNKVLMTAKVSRDLISTVVNNSGTIAANEVISQNGEIFLTGEGGHVSNTGKIAALSPEGEGAKVHISSTHHIEQQGDIISAGLQISGNTINANGTLANNSTRANLNISADHKITFSGILSSASDITLTSLADIEIEASSNSRSLFIEAGFDSRSFSSGQSNGVGTLSISGDFNAQNSIELLAGTKIDISGNFTSSGSQFQVFTNSLQLTNNTTISSGGDINLSANNITGSHTLGAFADKEFGVVNIALIGFDGPSDRFVDINVDSVQLGGDIIFANNITTQGSQLFFGDTFILGDLTAEKGDISITGELLVFSDSNISTAQSNGNISIGGALNEFPESLLFGTNGPITQETLGPTVNVNLDAGSGSISVGDIGTNLLGSLNDRDQNISQKTASRTISQDNFISDEPIDSPFDPRFDSTFSRGFGQLTINGGQVKFGEILAEGDVIISSDIALSVNRNIESNFGNVQLNTKGLFTLAGETSIAANTVSIQSLDSDILGKIISSDLQLNAFAGETAPEPTPIDQGSIISQVSSLPDTDTTVSTTTTTVTTDNNSSVDEVATTDPETDLQAQILAGEDPTDTQEAPAAGEENLVEIEENIQELPLIDNTVASATGGSACVP